MELYYHRTSGGAEYYSTTYTECPNGEKEGTAEGTVLRTDGDELEVMSLEQVKRAGFKTVRLGVISDNERADILNALHDMRSKYGAWPTNELSQQRMAEIDALIKELTAIL